MPARDNAQKPLNPKNRIVCALCGQTIPVTQIHEHRLNELRSCGVKTLDEIKDLKGMKASDTRWSRELL